MQDLTGVEMIPEASTAAYCCMLTSQGELMYGVGDHASHQLIDPQYVSLHDLISCFIIRPVERGEKGEVFLVPATCWGPGHRSKNIEKGVPDGFFLT